MKNVPKQDDRCKDDDHARVIKELEEFYYPQKFNKSEEPTLEDAPIEEPLEEEDSNEDDSATSSGTSWLKSILEFARRTFEEDE